MSETTTDIILKMNIKSKILLIYHRHIGALSRHIDCNSGKYGYFPRFLDYNCRLPYRLSVLSY
jgi:hypothetical protein